MPHATGANTGTQGACNRVVAAAVVQWHTHLVHPGVVNFIEVNKEPC